ncbi:MAG: cobalamin biosynthesis protein CobG [Pseudomonadota bacterium]
MTRRASPIVKGWCPGAYRPMMSGDGLVVRVRPFRASLTPSQTRALCDLARRFGNGTLDLTSRANLQIRGVAEQNHPPLLQALKDIGLIEADPHLEGQRNILLAADWQKGDLTDRLYAKLLDALPKLPPLPEKMGYALDTGAETQLTSGSADFRFERSAEGHLMLRADGAAKGRIVTEAKAMSALTDMIAWFIDTGGSEVGRMSRQLRSTPLPASWQETPPRPTAPALEPGPFKGGMVLGVPFGSMVADDLEAMVRLSGVTGMRVMPGRLLWLQGATPQDPVGFVTKPASPLLNTHACPGAPLCPQATVETRALARRLAGTFTGTLHVSGCAKGCALPRRADITLTGRNGRFDLVRNGAPWEEPSTSGLCPDTLQDLSGFA